MRKNFWQKAEEAAAIPFIPQFHLLGGIALHLIVIIQESGVLLVLISFRNRFDQTQILDMLLLI